MLPVCIKCTDAVASFPGLLAPAFVACSTNAPALVLQATNAGARRPGNEATDAAPMVYTALLFDQLVVENK